MTFALPGESMTTAIARDMAGASAEAADWFLHPVLAALGDGTGTELAALAADAIDLTRRTGAPLYIVHLFSAAALDRCRQARGSAWATSTRSAALTRRGPSRPSSTRPWTW